MPGGCPDGEDERLSGSDRIVEGDAADYPTKFAGAQFGLGRAYKAAGDAATAKVSYQKALAIGPTFKKASDGLNALR